MRYIKHFLLGSILWGLSISAFAQSATVKGRVTSEKGVAISHAQVYLSDSKWALTDEKGNFSLTAIADGAYTLKITRIGYSEYNQDLVIKAGESKTLAIQLEEKVYEEKPVVVTASRTQKDLEDVSVPITVIGKNEIESSGSLRLSDVLNEQVGLNIVSDHGTGIQVQGFDPEYTLILIDNQPVIGRTAGTLNLDRLAVGDVKQIEIVKGPSSALWGSDALAGVINIITEKGREPFSWNTTGRYGSNESYDASSNMSFRSDKLSGRIFGNVNGSEGYDLNKNTLAPTVPAFKNYTFSSGIDYRLTKSVSFGISGRYYKEDQSYKDEISVSGSNKILDGEDYQIDYSLTPELKLYFGSKQYFEITSFVSRFKNENNLNFSESGDVYFNDSFDQTLNKFEVKSSTFWSPEQTTVLGTGINREGLNSEIYASVPSFDSYFAFGQHEWSPSDKFSITGGFRFDAHSEYKSQLSPKLSSMFKPNKYVHVRASIGGGFKAPDFRQLFLNFTNPLAGYSVFGSSTVAEGIQTFQENGQIAELYFAPEQIEEIKAEHSFSYNAGVDVFPTDDLQLRFNLFRNDVRDLIETQRIATKTNGQSIFSYFNLNKIYTQGLETEIRFKPSLVKGLRIALGYQYLDAQREVTTQMDDVQNGEVVTITKNEYVPLFNRSKHTSNLKIFYTLESLGLDASLRMQYRGKYGFADINVNNRIDDEEYTDAYTVINTSIAKTFSNRFKLLFGIDNIMNYQDSQFLPSNPGITFYTQLNIKIY